MSVRSVRFHDLMAVRHIEAEPNARVLWSHPFDRAHSAMHLAFASAWQDVNQTVFTFVDLEHGVMKGLIQAAARPDHDAWDLVHLALRVEQDEERERLTIILIEELLAAIGGRGGLRTFARTLAGGDAQRLLQGCAFQAYTTEYTLISERVEVVPAPLPDPLQLRARRPSDAWGLFQLYCSVAPAHVRHAEGLSSRRWGRGSWLTYTLGGRLLPTREVVLEDEGLLVGWARLVRLQNNAAQRLEIMLHPRVFVHMTAFLTHAIVVLKAPLDNRTVCQVRTYEDIVLAGLRASGFTVAAEHTLLVKHATARVTERQLLIAALRAQGLGLDVSHYHPQDAGIAMLEHTAHD